MISVQMNIVNQQIYTNSKGGLPRLTSREWSFKKNRNGSIGCHMRGWNLLE